MRLEITIECDDDVRAEDCQAIATQAATLAQVMLSPIGAVFAGWRLVATEAHGATFLPARMPEALGGSNGANG